MKTDTGSSDTPVTETPEETKDVQEVASTTETKQEPSDNAQAAQTEDKGQSEETFFDPTNLAPELLPVYKGMQSAYTKKTQELATLRKEAEGYKENAEKYAKYEKYFPIVEEMLSSDKAQPAQNPDLVELETQLRAEGYSDDAIKMMKMGAQVILNSFNKERTADREQAELSGKILEAEKVDQRLNDQSLVYEVDGQNITFGELVAKMVFSNPEWRKDPVGETQKAIKTIDALIGQAKIQGKEELSNQAKTKAAKFPAVTSSPQSAAGASKPKTIAEAAEEAKKELGY